MSRNRAQRRFQAAAAAAAVLVTMSAACSGAGGDRAPAGACDTPGLSGEEIRLGVLNSVSGNYSAVWGPFADGVRARVEAQNAEGGVGGRKLVLSVADDGSDTGRNLSAARELVEGRDVLAIASGTSATQGGGSYLQKAGIAVTGYAATADFEIRPNFVGNWNLFPGPGTSKGTSAVWGELLARKGATRLYSVGSGTPASARSATALVRSAEAVGIARGVLTTDLPVGTTDFTGEAVKARAAGVDALALPLPTGPSIAALQAMRQAGVPVKTALMSTGYDPRVLRESAAALEGASIAVTFAPFELNLPAHQRYSAAMARSAPGVEPAQQFAVEGWLAANLLITGINAAGSCPTRAGVLSAIQGLTRYDADGLVPVTDFTAADHGAPARCTFVVDVVGGRYVPESAKPFCASDTRILPV